MPLFIESRAAQYLRRPRPGQAVLINIYCNYGMPVEALSVEWNPQHLMHRDPTVALIGEEQGVPVYAGRRVAAYIRWHTLRLTTQGPGWWSALAVAGSQATLQDMARWERLHPGLFAALPPPDA